MSQAGAYAAWDYDKELRQTFRDRDALEAMEGGGSAGPMVLAPGERIKVRYFAEPVPVYDLRNPEMVYGHARTIFDVADKDAGKSAHLEVFGEGHLERGNHLIDFHGCYSADTEVLTDSGWRRFPDLTGGEALATVSPRTGELEFQFPTARQAYYYDGPMVRIGGFRHRLDLLVTPNHRLVYKTRGRARTGVMEAGALLRRARGLRTRYTGVKIPKAAVWSGLAEPAPVEVRRGRSGALALVPPRAYLSLLGWYLAEGSCYSNGPCLSLNPKDPAEVARVEAVVREAGFNFSTHGGKVYIYSRGLRDLLKPLGTASEKYVPRWVMNLPPSCLDSLLAAVAEGDGAKQGGRTDVTTVSRRLADDLQEVALRCGYACDVASAAPRTATLKDGRTITGRHRTYFVRFYRTQSAPEVKTDAVVESGYGGMVYCATVPNGALVVRRNGKACVCGNSVDNESMAWLRSPWVEGRSVLIVHGPTCKLEFKGPKSWETKDANKLSFSDYSSYDMMLSSPKFFMDNDGTKDFTTIGRFLRRLLIHRENSKPIIYVIIREASEIIYSRIKADERQDEVKAQILSGLGQARHIGVSLGLDTQRAVNVDKAFRDLADYTFYKRPRGENMPDEKKFAYRYVDLDPMLTMANNQFVVVDTKGVGEGVNYLPPWHKREDDVMLAQLGIVQSFVEAPQAGEGRGDTRTMGDLEHAQMIRLYVEGDGKHGPYSMNEIADLLDVSSATPYYHITNVHNKQVKEKGECSRCLRASGPWMHTEVGR